jgi:DNA gyrase/topoisomerase IV subunit A
MATNIPPHNLREVADGALWALENPDATREELLEALMQRIPGPDFPTRAQILGTRGIKDAYRTGRGSITMRAVVNIEEIQGRTCLVITELPYQVNPDNVAAKIRDLARKPAPTCRWLGCQWVNTASSSLACRRPRKRRVEAATRVKRRRTWRASRRSSRTCAATCS